MSRSASCQLSRCVVDDFEGRLADDGFAAHVFHGRRIQHDATADDFALEQAEQAVLRQRRRAHRRRQADVLREFLEQGTHWPPGRPMIS